MRGSLIGMPMFPATTIPYQKRFVETVSARAHGRRIVKVEDGRVISIDLKQPEEPQAPFDPHQRDPEVPAT